MADDIPVLHINAASELKLKFYKDCMDNQCKYRLLDLKQTEKVFRQKYSKYCQDNEIFPRRRLSLQEQLLYPRKQLSKNIKNSYAENKPRKSTDSVKDFTSPCPSGRSKMSKPASWDRTDDMVCPSGRARVASSRCYSEEPKLLQRDSPFGSVDAKFHTHTRRRLSEGSESADLKLPFLRNSRKQQLDVNSNDRISTLGQLWDKVFASGNDGETHTGREKLKQEKTVKEAFSGILQTEINVRRKSESAVLNGPLLMKRRLSQQRTLPNQKQLISINDLVRNQSSRRRDFKDSGSLPDEVESGLANETKCADVTLNLELLEDEDEDVQGIETINTDAANSDDVPRSLASHDDVLVTTCKPEDESPAPEAEANEANEDESPALNANSMPLNVETEDTKQDALTNYRDREGNVETEGDPGSKDTETGTATEICHTAISKERADDANLHLRIRNMIAEKARRASIETPRYRSPALAVQRSRSKSINSKISFHHWQILKFGLLLGGTQGINRFQTCASLILNKEKTGYLRGDNWRRQLRKCRYLRIPGERVSNVSPINSDSELESD